ncbi:MAG: hypothetical protein KAR42_02555 [candidate division Zixibacteria bacterium]|nr:hypothetical protein [candidate division Zixibacteria bacterium]
MGFNSRKNLVGILIAIAIICLVYGTSDVQAQDVASGQISATVVAALTVTASSPLAFGTVYQGVPKSISKNVADAAVFDISGQANADLLIYASLPEFVATSTGDDRMTVRFSATDADIDTAIVGAGAPATFVGGWQGEDPHNLMGVAGADPCLGDAGLCAIFIGGKVIPTLDQTAGAYTGDIILTVAYQGT